MTTKIIKKITTDRLTGDFLVDGRRVDQIEVPVGNEVILEVDITDSQILDSDRTIWVTLDSIDTDLRRRIDSGNAFRLPRISTLMGEPLPSECGQIPNRGGRLIMDLSSAKIEDILHAKLWNYKGEIDGTLPNVKIVSGPNAYSCPEDFRTEIGSDDGIVVRLEPSALRPVNSIYRVKHRLPGWVQGQGTRNGRIVMRPFANSKFRMAWLTTDDYSVSPIKIVVVSEPTIQLSTSVDSRMPEGMKDEASGFAVMLKDFFDFACRSDGPLTSLMNLDTLRDIDKTKPAIIERMINERAPFIALNSIADRRLVLKHAVRFFENRGNPRSWAYLTRVIFGEECEVSYPSEKVFRTSDGDWRQFDVIKGISISQVVKDRPSMTTQVLKTLSMTAEDAAICTPDLLMHLTGVQIKGLTSSASAIVEDVIQTSISGEVVTEFKLSNIKGEFQSFEIVVVKDGLTISDFPTNIRSIRNFSFYTGRLVKSVKAPKGIPVGTQLVFTNCGDATGIISDVDGDVEVFSPGWIRGTPSVIANGVPLEIEIGCEFKERGEWIGGQSFLSDNGYRIQDGFYYQLFSYVVSSDLPEEKVIPHTREFMHPVGFKAFYRRNTETTVASVNLESTSRTAVLELPRRTIHVGSDLNQGRCNVYSNGSMIDNPELVFRNEENAFVRIGKSDSIRDVTVNITSDIRGPSVAPSSNHLESTTTVGQVNSAPSQNPEIGQDLWSDSLVASYIRGQLGDSNPNVWWRAYIAYRTDDGVRTSRPGVTLVRNGARGIVVAAFDDEAYVGGVVAFESFDDAQDFQFDTQIKRIVL